MLRSHQMMSHAKQVADSTMHCEKPLNLADRFEPPHLSFPLVGGFMGHLCSVICVLIGTVRNG